MIFAAARVYFASDFAWKLVNNRTFVVLYLVWISSMFILLWQNQAIFMLFLFKNKDKNICLIAEFTVAFYGFRGSLQNPFMQDFVLNIA